MSGMAGKLLRSVARLAFSASVFGFGGYTVISLARFLSFSKAYVSATSTSKGAFVGLLWDTGLALLFCVQHTLLSSEKASRWAQVSRWTHGAMYRTFYIISCCLSLMLLIWQWEPVHTHPLWNIDTPNSSFIWWAFALTHYASWALIYAGSVIVDLGDLTGIKQVWLSSEGHVRPYGVKSWQLSRFLQHMRHPGFLALTLILWFHPRMTLDRAVLALIFTLYPFAWFQVDMSDYDYCRSFYRSKWRGMYRRTD